MNAWPRIALQLVLFVVFAAVLRVFSVAPAYQYAQPGVAVATVSISHAAERVTPCVQRSVEEIAAMPANERRPTKCERERLPLIVEVEVDGAALARFTAEPSGLWRDGAGSIYEKFELPPGRHTITARLRDTARESGWDYTHTETVELEAGRYFTLTFQAETGGFRFR